MYHYRITILPLPHHYLQSFVTISISAVSANSGEYSAKIVVNRGNVMANSGRVVVTGSAKSNSGKIVVTGGKIVVNTGKIVVNSV